MYLVIFRGSYLLQKITVTTEYDIYFSAKNDQDAMRMVRDAMRRWTTYKSAKIINWSDGKPDRWVATL